MTSEYGLNLRAVLETIPDGIVVCDPDGRLRFLNAAAAALLGVDPLEQLGQPLAGLPGGGVLSECLVDESGQLAIENRFLHFYVTSVYDEKGEWVGTMVTLRDTTYEVHVEQRMHELLSILIHRAAGPLTPILGYADIMLSGAVGSLSDEQRKSLAAIKSNTSELVHLVTELNDISRLDQDHVSLERRDLSIASLVQQVANAVSAEFADRAILFNVHIGENLPLVHGDEERLKQVLLNLLDNARKYTPRGGRVDVRVWNYAGQVRVDVEDTGVGIPELWKSRIFTPFFRAYNPHLMVDKQSYSGWGLSLAITKGLVELHGGSMWFESAEGDGSCFSFTLPIE